MSVQILNINELNSLVHRFAIPQTDLFLIAINRYGLKANVPDKRLRFKIRLLACNEIFYMAVCINTFDSPFNFDEHGRIFMNEKIIGYIFDIEKDTCDTTYYRRNKTEMTLNSNMRSQCEGCTFCGTYNLEPEDRIDMSDENKISAFLDRYLKENQMNDLSNLVRVTVCTGCFSDEMKLIEHILKIYKVFNKYGFNKRIRYIGSQIRTKEAMDIIQKIIPFFSLSLTVECFTNRELRMRKEKASLDMNGIKSVLKNSLEHNFSTNYLYIIGLDELSIFEQGVRELYNLINRLPVFQVMQNFINEHEEQRVCEAKELEYYLKARKIIESIFEKTNLKPRSWENYRGLFYTMYKNEPLNCIRI